MATAPTERSPRISTAIIHKTMTAKKSRKRIDNLRFALVIQKILAYITTRSTYAITQTIAIDKQNMATSKSRLNFFIIPPQDSFFSAIESWKQYLNQILFLTLNWNKPPITISYHRGFNSIVSPFSNTSSHPRQTASIEFQSFCRCNDGLR
jgi:hypothetical protein